MPEFNSYCKSEKTHLAAGQEMLRKFVYYGLAPTALLFNLAQLGMYGLGWGRAFSMMFSLASSLHVSVYGVVNLLYFMYGCLFYGEYFWTDTAKLVLVQGLYQIWLNYIKSAIKKSF